jgi:hypothetical protein
LLRGVKADFCPSKGDFSEGICPSAAAGQKHATTVMETRRGHHQKGRFVEERAGSTVLLAWNIAANGAICNVLAGRLIRRIAGDILINPCDRFPETASAVTDLLATKG